MSRQIIIVALTVLTVLWGLIDLGNDPFKNDNIELKRYTYSVRNGECLDEILERYYVKNTTFIDWDSYRNKHYQLNDNLIANNRFLQAGDNVMIYTLHKKGNVK